MKPSINVTIKRPGSGPKPQTRRSLYLDQIQYAVSDSNYCVIFTKLSTEGFVLGRTLKSLGQTFPSMIRTSRALINPDFTVALHIDQYPKDRKFFGWVEMLDRTKAKVSTERIKSLKALFTEKNLPIIFECNQDLFNRWENHLPKKKNATTFRPRKIVQIGRDGTKIATFVGMKAAGKAVNRSDAAISLAIKEKWLSGGYYWDYAE